MHPPKSNLSYEFRADTKFETLPCPQNLVPMTVEKFMKISSLVEDIKIDLETPLDADDDE